MNHITVSAGILVNNGAILCTQRGESKYEYISKKYEFPGGKVEEGEAPREALIREIKEELHMSLDPNGIIPFMIQEHSYPDFSITMHTFICHVDTRELVLTEHLDFKWLSGIDLLDLGWAPADIPIVKRLVEEGY